MNKYLDMDQDEILRRKHKALAYSTKVELRRIRQARKTDRMVKRIFVTAIGLWVFAVTLALLVGCV